MVGNIFTRAYENHQNDVKEQAIYKRKYEEKIIYCIVQKEDVLTVKKKTKLLNIFIYTSK